MTAAAHITSQRRARLAKVHIGKKQLGWDDDLYRAVLSTMFGVSSSKDLSDSQIDELLEHMAEKGFKAQSKNGPKPQQVVSRETVKRPSNTRATSTPVISKLRALWLSLYHMGVVRERDDKAIDAFVARQTKAERNGLGIAKMEWLSPQEAFKVVEALKKMALREAGCNFATFKNPRHAVLTTQLRILNAAKAVEPGFLSELAQAKAGVSRWTAMSDQQMDACIQEMGHMIRVYAEVKAAVTAKADNVRPFDPKRGRNA